MVLSGEALAFVKGVVVVLAKIVLVWIICSANVELQLTPFPPTFCLNLKRLNILAIPANEKFGRNEALGGERLKIVSPG